MKLPAGYQGAYEKALIAAGGKPRRLNMLEDEDIDDSDSESDFESPITPGKIRALTSSKPTHDFSDEPTPIMSVMMLEGQRRHQSIPLAKNTFEALADDDNPLDSTDIDALNGWAHRVSVKTKKLPKSRPLDVFDRITIRSEDELDAVMQQHPTLAAIPATDKKIRKMLRTKPIELECNADEVLCLVDSGSTINAAWVEKHVPQYSGHVKDTVKSLRGDHATTAGGAKLFNKGRVTIDSSADSMPFPINFKDMEVELPILSVRKMVKRGNDVRFVPDGGTITHRDTGRSITFHEHEGVYFLKLKVAGPDADSGQLDFVRPGKP